MPASPEATDPGAARPGHRLRRARPRAGRADRGLPNVDVTCLSTPGSTSGPSGIAAAVADRIAKTRAATAATSGSSSPTPTAGRAGCLDAVLEREGVERLAGRPLLRVLCRVRHLAALPDEEPGTFYLTDFLARQFDRSSSSGSASTGIPELLPVYFGNYRRLVYLAQTDDPALIAKAEAARLASGLTFERRMTGYGELGPDHPGRDRRRRLTMGDMTVIWWRDIPAQVVAREGRRQSKQVLHPRFQVAIDKAAARAGKSAYNDYIEEWRRVGERCGDDLEAEVVRRGRAPRDRLHEAPSRRAHPVRRRRGRTGAATRAGDPDPATRGRRAMTETVLSSATREVVIGFDRPVRDHRRAHQPDRPQGARRGDEGRRLQPCRARRARPGRGRRPHARRQRRHPARRRAGDPRPDDPAGPVADRPAAVDRLVDRRGARGRARRLPGQAARQLGHRRGGAPRARPAARQEVRRRGRRDQQRRHRDQRGPRRPVRGREADRRARRRPRHPALGHRRRPAGHADRRAWRTAGRQVFALVRRLRDELKVNTTCGASNVSFGLPNREGINAAFLPMAIAVGHDLGHHEPDACPSSRRASWRPTS